MVSTCNLFGKEHGRYCKIFLFLPMGQNDVGQIDVKAEGLTLTI